MMPANLMVLLCRDAKGVEGVCAKATRTKEKFCKEAQSQVFNNFRFRN